MNFERLSPENAAVMESNLAGMSQRWATRIRRATFEKNCESCGRLFLCGGAAGSVTKAWRRLKKARFCSRLCCNRENLKAHYAPRAKHAPTERPSVKDIAWAAGVFEGEGHVRGHANGSRGLSVTVTQKDDWMLDRMRALFGGSVVHMGESKCYQTAGRWVLSGARAWGFALTIYSLLSPRRRAQVKQAMGAL